jgi:hypothetical protein
MDIEIILPNRNENLESLEQIKKAIAAFDFPEHIKTMAVWNVHSTREAVTREMLDRPEDLLLLFWAHPEGCETARHQYWNVCGKNLNNTQKDGTRLTSISELMQAELFPIYELTPERLELTTTEASPYPSPYPIAYQWYNALLVPYDLPHGSYHIQHILGYLFKQINWNRLRKYTPAPITDTFLGWWTAFIEAQSQGLSLVDLITIQNHIGSHERQIRDYKQQIEKDELVKAGLQKMKELLATRYQSELAALQACPGVYRVSLTGRYKLSIVTEPLMVQGGREFYDLGQLEIILDSSRAGRGGVKVKRYGQIDFGICHPHINMSGQPCFGNIRELCETLLSQGEIAALTMTILQYLQSPTDGTDIYVALTHFPLVVTLKAEVTENESEEVVETRAGRAEYAATETGRQTNINGAF